MAPAPIPTTGLQPINKTAESNPAITETVQPQSKLAKLMRNAQPRAKKMWEGLSEAALGGFSAIQNPEIQANYKSFLSSMAVVLTGMYAAVFVLGIIYMPVVLFLAAWAPGLIGQLLTMIPLWSYNIVRKRRPMSNNQLFLDELEVLSPQRAQELSKSMDTRDQVNPNWKEDLYHDLKTSWHFTKYSLMFLSLSIIPVVGSFLTFLGQTYLVADRMGWNLLSVYTISSKKMSYRQQKHWMRARKWRIIGFTLPYVLLSSIPFIGPLTLGIAQAATAHIYFHLLSKDAESPEKKNTGSPLIEFKKAN
jgi:hypothetical protein